MLPKFSLKPTCAVAKFKPSVTLSVCVWEGGGRERIIIIVVDYGGLNLAATINRGSGVSPLGKFVLLHLPTSILFILRA